MRKCKLTKEFKKCNKTYNNLMQELLEIEHKKKTIEEELNLQKQERIKFGVSLFADEDFRNELIQIAESNGYSKIKLGQYRTNP